VRAAAVLYVGDLDAQRAFYERCFGLRIEDEGTGFCGLASEAWLLTLVQSDEAVPASTPPARRGETPVKLAFSVRAIDDLRPLVAELGGVVDPSAAAWQFRDALHCDLVDPEGNVVQLVQPLRP
jgi:predicted enzyme related to lactoylglutathione lyase